MISTPTVKALLALTLAGAFSVAAPAAPPESQAPEHHHSPLGITPDMLLPLKSPQPSELPNKGKVLSLFKTDSYAFIEVAQGKDSVWVAGPLAPMELGDTIGYSDGSVMTNFHSKTLGRTFPSLLFADHVAVIPGAK